MALEFFNPGTVQPGWPNLPDQGLAMVSAASAGAQIGLAKGKLQEALAVAQLKNATQENEFNQRMAMMGMNAVQKQMEFNQTLDFKERQLEDAARNRTDEIRHRNFLDDRKTAIDDDSEAFLGLLAASGLHPGDQGYDTALMKEIAAHHMATNNPAVARIIAINENDHNNSTTKSEREIDADFKQLKDEWNQTVWSGANLGFEPMWNQSKWQPAYVDAQGRHPEDIGFDKSTVKPEPGTRKLVNKDNLGNPIINYVKVADVDRLRKRLGDNQERRRKLANYIDDPTTGVRHIPRSDGGPLDKKTAYQIMAECGNNIICARQKALELGYSLP